MESIAIKVCIRLSADYGLCRSELLFKRLRCNVEQAPRLTAVSERGDAAGFGGALRVWPPAVLRIKSIIIDKVGIGEVGGAASWQARQ